MRTLNHGPLFLSRHLTDSLCKSHLPHIPSRRSCHQQGMSAVGPIETPGLPPKASDLDEVRGAEVAEVCVHMILEQAEGKAGGEPERTKSSKSFVMNCIQYGSPVDGSAGRGFGKRVA